MISEKNHCALCLNCKVFNQSNDGGATYIRKVRCTKGHWRGRHGQEIDIDIHNLRMRLVAECPDFETVKSELSKRDQLADIYAAIPGKRVIRRRRNQ